MDLIKTVIGKRENSSSFEFQSDVLEPGTISLYLHCNHILDQDFSDVKDWRTTFAFHTFGENIQIKYL